MISASTMALFAGVTALWSQIQGVFARIRALLICRTTLQGDVAEAAIDYLQTHARIVNWGDRFIRCSHSWVRPLDRVALVAYETAPMQPRIAFLHGLPLMFAAVPNQNEANIPYPGIVTLTALRGTLDVNELTRSAIEFASLRKTQGKRYFIRQIRNLSQSTQATASLGGGPRGNNAPSPVDDLRPTLKFLHWNSDDIGAPRPSKPFDSYALSDVTAAAIQDFRR